MRFKDNKAIYLQIADLICDDILQREYAATVEVNANTCARAYDWLQNKEIIYTKRGLGYFVSVGAKTAILQMKREEFMNETLPDVARQMANLNISMDELTKGVISFQMRNDN